MDSAIIWINHYPADRLACFVNTYQECRRAMANQRHFGTIFCSKQVKWLRVLLTWPLIGMYATAVIVRNWKLEKCVYCFNAGRSQNVESIETYVLLHRIIILERFSFECRKVIGFAFATLHDWLKKFAPIFHPIRSKTKTNRDSLATVFPRFASATCNYFELWLVHCIVCVLCDWLE